MTFWCSLGPAPARWKPVSNLSSPGDKVLVLTAGKFGERWTALGKAYGCSVETLSKPYGETFSLEEVRAQLTPDIRAVYMQATESSTGARHDVKGIAKLVRGKGAETLLVVDAITGLGTTHFDIDAWGIDLIIGGSQKALMIPPGLAYCAVSERAWKRMETANLRATISTSAKKGRRRPRENQPTRRRHRCLPRSEQRWISSARWEMATWWRGAKP